MKNDPINNKTNVCICSEILNVFNLPEADEVVGSSRAKPGLQRVTRQTAKKGREMIDGTGKEKNITLLLKFYINLFQTFL